MNEVVERVARAIWQAQNDFDPWVSEQRKHLPKRTWENVEECERESARRDARTAMAALSREHGEEKS